jgi:ketosteroid isomerase-like protein
MRIAMNKIILIFTEMSLLLACTSKEAQEKKMAEARDQIFQTEKAFEQLAAEKGLAEAFSFYAADSGIVSRRDTLLQGKETIRKFYEERNKAGVSLKWTPDFIDVSASCDLGYTYGKYTYSVTDSTGKVNESRGFFHTVWKKQKDGSWRFVWD